VACLPRDADRARRAGRGWEPQESVPAQEPAPAQRQARPWRAQHSQVPPDQRSPDDDHDPGRRPEDTGQATQVRVHVSHDSSCRVALQESVAAPDAGA
jgi:hypothetical protein